MSNQVKKTTTEEENLELDTDLKIFLKQWFSGFLKGIKELDDDNLLKILALTGRACVKIHSSGSFWEIWEATRNIDDFISKINEFHGEEIYKRVDNRIFVTYTSCRCPLVKFDIVNSPVICYCFNRLGENFETILKESVKVFTENTILRGGKCCKFIIFIGS
ncbi:MAG: hypothetical protein JSW11_07250 [Candidatus Heimdallarchaeota archaeon]|nr:MAG: hypothetical protein JSW11_07250 [Candidatus Heimdallarchaeota archaeon]